MSERWDASAPSDKGSDEYIVWEAKKRHAQCVEWESTADKNGDDDERFANGDAVNNWQWPATVWQFRNPSNGPAQPCLTINKTRQHCLQIINDQRQNKSSPKVVPVSDGADRDAADVFMGIIRHIENQSNATAAYDNGCWNQVIRGIGYWRVCTDYAHDGTLNQEIYIRRIQHPKGVKLDPNIKEADGSDARFGFIYEDIARDQFERDYPDANAAEAPLDDGRDTWVQKDTVRVAEYYRKTVTKDQLHRLVTGETVRASDYQPPKEVIAASRDLEITTIQHFKIAGSTIVERTEWPGKFIPIVRVVGEETVIDGVLDRKGHVRALIDPQRMYNYWSSALTEQVALQTKIPWLVGSATLDSFGKFYEMANTVNMAYLPYKEFDDQGNALPAPSKISPPVMSEAYLKGLQITANEMMMVSGQYQAEMGAPSNERSGVAIERRQRQADNATYHYVDRMAQAIRFTGRILIDLIPKIYDVQRVVRILGEDGSEDYVQIDPEAQQAHQKHEMDEAGKAKVIFNPNIGQYAVEADVGPSYMTKRQEGFEALTQVITHNESMAPVVGDIWMNLGDFPEADKVAQRLRAMVPPAALADDPAVANVQMAAKAHMQQAAQQMQQMQQAMQSMSAQLAAAKLERRDKDEKTVVDAYKAETDRLSVVAPMMQADALRPIVQQLIMEMMQTPAGSA